MEHLNEFKETLLEKQKTLAGNLAAADNNVIVAKQSYDRSIDYRNNLADELEAVNASLSKLEDFEKWDKDQNKKKATTAKKAAEPSDVL